MADTWLAEDNLFSALLKGWQAPILQLNSLKLTIDSLSTIMTIIPHRQEQWDAPDTMSRCFF